MVWAGKIGKVTVRFDDLTPAAWIRIQAEFGNWATVYAVPLSDPAACLVVLEECVRVAEPDCQDPAARVAELTPSIRKLSDLLVECEDDMPTGIRDGVPSKGADSSTAT